jgi:two-component sensor histidine kinase
LFSTISVYRPGLEYFVAIFDVITERKQTEDALRTSLAEKVALLKEVHHRVKNNLQIVDSLLRLQANRSQDQNVVDVWQDTRSRVNSMALLHEGLYRSSNLANVNFAAYVEDLTKQLLRSYGVAAARITLENRVAPLCLPLDKFLPFGLIINELISNALKHAFPGERPGTITVTMAPAGEARLLLSVAVNGVGLSSTNIDFTKNYYILGLRLVSNLVGQLRGTMTVEQSDGGGTVFREDFPLPQDTLPEGNILI